MCNKRDCICSNFLVSKLRKDCEALYSVVFEDIEEAVYFVIVKNYIKFIIEFFVDIEVAIGEELFDVIFNIFVAFEVIESNFKYFHIFII